MRPHLRKARRWLSYLVGGFILLLALGEIGLRVAGLRFRLPTVCTWKKSVGCVLLPNLSEDLAAGKFSMHFTTNSDGLRGRDHGPKPAGVRRVVVIGDSVAFGIGAGDDETFAARLDTALEPEHIEVLNAANPFLKGTEQQLSYLVDYGPALQPDLVLLGFATKNDFIDNMRQEFWRRGPQGLERVTDWEPPWHTRLVLETGRWALSRWLGRHSWLFGLFQFYAFNVVERVHLSTESPQPTEDVLVRMQEVTRKMGARFAMVVLPSREATERLRQQPQTLDDHEASIDALARSHGIPFVDVTETLARFSGPATQHPDGHLTPIGHEAVAKVLRDRIPEWLPAAR